MNKKGFTLIELLVVIAIIGILSSIAIVYLNDARNKANDAKVISNVTTISTQVEVDRAGNTTPSTGTIDPMINKLGSHPCAGTWSYSIGASSVVVYSSLCTDNAVYYCADSNSFRGTTTVPTAQNLAAGVCR